jgi:Amt family ammonium transporter
VNGLLYGNPKQFFIQITAVLAVLVYTLGGTFALLKLIAKVTPLRASDTEENMGLDLAQHGEQAYSEGEGAILVPLPQGTPANAARTALQGAQS